MSETLIFDLFGTLVFFDDSRVPTAEIGGRTLPMTVRELPALLARYLPAVDPLEFLRELRKVSAAVAEEKRQAGIELHSAVRFERTLRAFGADAATALVGGRHFAEQHMATLTSCVVCPDDRRDLLRDLSKRHRLALLSNFDCGPSGRRVLAEAGIAEFFEVIVISEEEGLRKPNAELFHRTCSKLAARPEDCLYIGDTLLEDIEGATGAGLSALWIHLDAEALSPATAVLPDVSALPQWLSMRRHPEMQLEAKRPNGEQLGGKRFGGK